MNLTISKNGSLHGMPGPVPALEVLHRATIVQLETSLTPSEHLEKEQVLADRIERIFDTTDTRIQLSDDRRRIAWYREHLFPQYLAGKTVLELGCSQGVVSCEAARHAKHVTGFDIRPEAISGANSLQKEHYPDLTNVHFTIEAGECPEHPEVTLLLEVLEHCNGELQANLLKQAARSPLALISVPNRFPEPHYDAEERSRWPWEGHISHFNMRRFTELVEQHFSNVEELTMPGEHSAHSGIWLHLVCSN